MLDLLQEKLKHYATIEEKYNYLREQLQLLILKILDETEYFTNLAFVGGTALRILYDLKRFSEALDFSLIESKNYNFGKLITKLEQELKLNNMAVSTKYKDKKTVASAFIKFDTILYELGLTTHQDHKLNIKFEVDQNPPPGYQTELSVLNKEYLLTINHYDLPSLFASKLHAILCRKYAKGRDYYDFIWYTGRKVIP